MQVNQPPKALVMTWLEILKESSDEDVKKHVTNMLIGAFGSMKAVADYVETNKIPI